MVHHVRDRFFMQAAPADHEWEIRGRWQLTVESDYSYANIATQPFMCLLLLFISRQPVVFVDIFFGAFLSRVITSAAINLNHAEGVRVGFPDSPRSYRNENFL